MKDPPLPILAVGSFPANAFGLYDMRGNAWEWCRDWANPGESDASWERDPTGPAAGCLKIVRGSDWLYVGQRCTLGFRATEPSLRSPFIGFRVVCVQPDPG
jgi:formylglycine-generating enzyme required for sulfatase activity